MTQGCSRGKDAAVRMCLFRTCANTCKSYSCTDLKKHLSHSHKIGLYVHSVEPCIHFRVHIIIDKPLWLSSTHADVHCDWWVIWDDVDHEPSLFSPYPSLPITQVQVQSVHRILFQNFSVFLLMKASLYRVWNRIFLSIRVLGFLYIYIYS